MNQQVNMSTMGDIRRKALAILVAAASGVTASGSFAQAGDSVMEEVVVTATGRAQNVQDIPYNISAMSGDAIEGAQIVDSADLMRAIPGVAVVDRGYRNAGVINGVMIRGLNVDGAALGDYSLSAVPTVSTYVNSTPLYANFVLKDIERVEVLRGPQGTLYGSGSLGGTVRYIMKAPELGDFFGKVGASLSKVKGSDGLGATGDLSLNIPMGDTLALRLSGGKIDYDGITDYVNVYELDNNGIPVAPSGIFSTDASYVKKEDADTVDIGYARASLLYEPSDSLRFVLSYQQQSDEIGGRRQQTLGSDGFGRPYEDYENGSVQLEPSSRDVNLTSLEAEVDLGFATLTSSSSYYDHEGESVSENTGFYAQAGFLSFYYNYPRPMASAVRTYADQAFIQELRLVSNTDGPLDYVLGLYYQDQTLESTQDSYLRGFKAWWDAAFPAFAAAVTSDKDFVYERDETFKDKAIYGELTYHLSDAFRVTGGMRYFDNEFTNDTFMDIPIFASLSAPTSPSFEVDEDDVLFKVNASWDLSEDHMLYGTVSEGYRRGGANAVPLEGRYAEDPDWQRYDSDAVINYEVGLKGESDSHRYTVSLFYVDWDDVQVNTATNNWGFFAVRNGGEARSMGLELEVDGYITEQLHYGIGYAFVDAELKEDIFAPNAATPLALSGAQLPGTAEHTINAAMDYTMTLNNGLSWTSRIDGYFQSSTRNAINNSSRFNVKLDAFQLWNISSTLSAESWSASLFLKNIFNEAGVTGVFTEAYMGTLPSANYQGNGSKEFISVPRAFGVALNYSF